MLKNVVHVCVGGSKDGHVEQRGRTEQAALTERCTDGGWLYANKGVVREDEGEVVYRFEPMKCAA
jgi:hypothetical protein